jgi:hypothetical protein
MGANNSLYHVLYEYGNKEPKQDFVVAAAGDFATISAVLVSNGRAHPSGAIKIIAVKNCPDGPQGNILS